jgi:hypothetical protein
MNSRSYANIVQNKEDDEKNIVHYKLKYEIEESNVNKYKINNVD